VPSLKTQSRFFFDLQEEFFKFGLEQSVGDGQTPQPQQLGPDHRLGVHPATGKTKQQKTTR